MKNIKSIAGNKAFLSIIISIVALFFGRGYVEEFLPSVNDISTMKVHFLDVGQGDCIIIESDGRYMIVDGGGNNKGEIVVDYLNILGVKTIDYLIGTHPHEDHIGGLIDVVHNFKIKNVILPEKEHTTITFENLVNALIENQLKITAPIVGEKFTIGNGEFTIIAPNGEYGNNLNNWSVGIKLTNGENNFIMYGDSEKQAEYDMIDSKINLEADVLKISHHGSVTSSDEKILKAIGPKYGVIQSGLDNSYNHPHQELISSLEKNNIKYFRTDKQGTVIATSDGENITWDQEPY